MQKLIFLKKSLKSVISRKSSVLFCLFCCFTFQVNSYGHGGTVSLLIYTFSYRRVAQSVTCLATDACLTADPGVASSIPARYHTFVEIDHEMISTVILLPSADLFKKGCCQLQAKVCAQITG